MTEQTTTPPPVPQAPPTPASGIMSPEQAREALAAPKAPPWGDKPEDFDPDKAWKLIQQLRTEKGDPALRTELDALKDAQTKQRDALAAALGVKPEETSDSDKLAQQIDSLRGQILTSEKRALAVEFQIPAEYQHMLSATDADGLRKQAADLKSFAEAAHYAASTTNPAAAPPAFQANPGQGQGNAPLTPEAQAEADYQKFYPAPAKRQ